VLAAGEVWVKTQPQAEERRQAPVHSEGAGTGLEDAGDEAEERGLAGPIRPDDAQGFPHLHPEVDVPQGPEGHVGLSQVRLEHGEDGVFQQILPVGADDELLAELHTFDRGRHQASSAKRSLYRVKIQTPERVMRASHPAMRASWDSDGAWACRSAR